MVASNTTLLLVLVSSPHGLDLGRGLVLQGTRLTAFVQHFLQGDLTRVVELPEMLVEKLHSKFLAGLDAGVDSVGFVLTDKVRDSGGYDHKLISGDSTFAGGQWAESLTEYGNEITAQLNTNLLLLGYGKDVDQSGNRPCGAGRMDRAEDEVARFSRSDGGLDGLEVTQFADEYELEF